jgi:ABC-type transporter Mla MlaB component
MGTAIALATAMLRITRESPDAGEVVLHLSGQITGRWVGELGRACGEASEAGTLVALDLSEVSFIDLDGVALLRELRARSVAFTNCSLFALEQLKEVADVGR